MFKKGDEVKISLNATVMKIGGIDGDLVRIRISFGDPSGLGIGRGRPIPGESIQVYKTVHIGLLEKAD